MANRCLAARGASARRTSQRRGAVAGGCGGSILTHRLTVSALPAAPLIGTWSLDLVPQPRPVVQTSPASGSTANVLGSESKGASSCFVLFC